MKIVTQYIYPPVPFRDHDWMAYDSDEEGEGPTGYGETEVAALKDFIDEAIEHYQTIAYADGRQDEADEHRKQAMERALRAMNESGQGEHMGLT
jgi:hypothetical protein